MDGTTVSAIYYNTLFWGATTRMSPLVYKARADCVGSLTTLGSSYCLSGVAGSQEQNHGAAILGNMHPGQVFAQLTVSIANEPDLSAVDAFYYSGWMKFKGNTVNTFKSINAPVAFSGTLNVYNLTIGTKYACVRYTSVHAVPINCNHLGGQWDTRYVWGSWANHHLHGSPRPSFATVCCAPCVNFDFTGTIFRPLQWHIPLACPMRAPTPAIFIGAWWHLPFQSLHARLKTIHPLSALTRASWRQYP
jgi:hypothetical protein